MADNDYFGMYRGFVRNNDDPQRRGRLKLEVPEVLQDNLTSWALPCFPYSGDDVGSIFIPEEDDIVWVQFEGGDPNKPVWIGQTIAGNKDNTESPDEIDEDYPETKTIKTNAGHKIIFEDDANDPRLVFEHSSGSKEIFFNGDNVSGSKLIDLVGDFIAQSAGNVKLKGESNVALLSGLTMQLDSGGPITITSGNNPAGSIEVDSGFDISMNANTSINASSGGPININSGTAMNLSSSGAMNLSSSAGINISSQGVLNLSATQTNLGGETASHPIVYGDVLSTILTQMETFMTTHLHSGPDTPPKPPPSGSSLSISPSSMISGTVYTE